MDFSLIKKSLFLRKVYYLICRYSSYIISDEVFLRIKFKRRLGYKLDLISPKTFNEKIQWLKLYDKQALQQLCADKYAVRDYIRKAIGESYLIPLILKTNNVEDIRPECLPDYPVIIKTNHDSGNYFIIKDKTEHNWEHIRKVLKGALRSNYYYRSKEWQYKNIEPCIIVEKLLIDNTGSIPKDFKIYCFEGVAKLVQVDSDKLSIQRRNFFNEDWQELNLTLSGYNKIMNYPKPFFIDELIQLSNKLSSEFHFARIDWYFANNKIYFGEITFHPASGFGSFKPKEWERKMGDMIKI
jgi:hypothetical protein